MSVVSAIATGLKEGLEGYGENQRRIRAQEREDFLFAEQKKEAEERDRIRSANREYADLMRQTNAARANGQLPGADDNVTEEAVTAQQKSDESFARAEDRRFGITPPQAAQQPGRMTADASATMTPREQNIFKSGGEGLYKNQKIADDAYYKRIYDITANYLTATNQGDKIFDLQKRINDMREQGYEPLRKAAAAAVAMGDPNALKLVAKASEVSGTPYNIDPNSGVYDPKTQTYKGVKMIGPDGKSEVKDITSAQLLAGIGSLDAAKAIEFQFARSDAERNFGLKEREVAAGEKSADAKMISAQADKKYRDTQGRVLDENIKGSDVKARVQAIEEMFPLANKRLKPEDLLEFTGKDRQQKIDAYRASITADTNGRRIADNLASLNPKVDPRILGGAAKAAVGGSLPAKQIDKDTGRSYFQYGGQKIFVN